MFRNEASDLPTELASASGTNILHLNYDCLDAIFSSKCLSIEDLCSIEETDSRLKEVVDKVFTRRYKMTFSKKNTEFELETTRRILSNFGAFIPAFSIGEKLTSECLDWLVEFCGDTLESLELDGVEITKAQSKKLKLLLGNLQKISLRECHIDYDKLLFSDCQSLVELKLFYVSNQHLALENTFPKLIRFEYWKGETFFIGDSIWKDFFSRHKNLEALSLGVYAGTSHLLPMIADNCKQLAELETEFKEHEDKVQFQKALSSILTFEHLKTLKIQCAGRNVTEFMNELANLNSLEFLSLRFIASDSELVPALLKLTRLHGLELYCQGAMNLNPLAELEGLTELTIESQEDLDFDVVSIIKRLIRLKTLYLRVRSHEMDERMYQGIVDVLRERPGKLQDPFQISCFTAKNFEADSQFDKILKIYKLRNLNGYFEWSDFEWESDSEDWSSESEYDYSEWASDICDFKRKDSPDPREKN